MILRFTAEQLKKLAEQIEPLNQLSEAGGPDFDGKRVLTVDGQPVAFLTWYENSRQFVDFLPEKAGD